MAVICWRSLAASLSRTASCWRVGHAAAIGFDLAHMALQLGQAGRQVQAQFVIGVHHRLLREPESRRERPGLLACDSTLVFTGIWPHAERAGTVPVSARS